MARMEFEDWVPEENSSDVLTRVAQQSGIERFARVEPMGSQTKSVPRSGGVGVGVVAKGDPYGEDTSGNDDVVLQARKFGRAIRIAEEDLGDSLVDIIRTKLMDWATSYAKAIDNAALATTGAEDGSSVPFTSVYAALSAANAATDYAAGDNVIQTAGAVTYDHLSDLLGLYEQGDFYDPTGTVVIANPAFRASFRAIKDDQGQPIFVQGQGGDAGTPDRLFGEFPIQWSLGAKTSATNTDAPTGNPIMVIANRNFLILGNRSGPESVVIDGRDGVAALTDETILKARARRGFVLGHEKAAALLEVTAAV